MIKKMTEFYVYETVDFSINLTSKTQIAILEDVKDLVISFKQVIKNAYRNNRAFLEKNLSSDDIELDIENSRLNVHLSQEACIIFNKKTLEKYPDLVEILSVLEQNITIEEMIEMNYMVDVEGKLPDEVAHSFLVKKGIIK